MPVPLLKHHFCRRSGNGPKAHAHAAYISGTKLDDGHGRTADFTPKGGIIHAEVWAPSEAPVWAKDRGQLWRNLEAREDKSTRKAQAILAHKFIGALPYELSVEENIRYVKDFVREQFTRKGYAADWAIHAPETGGDRRNYHVHIMVPLRKFEKGDWAKTKDRFPKNSPALSQFIKGKQEAFFELQNRYLNKNGFKAQITRQHGKWTVVNGDSVLATMQARRPAYVTKPIARHSQGAGDILKDFRRAWLEISLPCKPNADSINFKMASGGKGWPAAAIADWEAWGFKAPARFFRLWPELSSGNATPGRGHMP